MKFTFSAAIRSSSKAFCVFFPVLDNCNATALSPTVGTTAFELATIFAAGYNKKYSLTVSYLTKTQFIKIIWVTATSIRYINSQFKQTSRNIQIFGKTCKFISPRILCDCIYDFFGYE